MLEHGAAARRARPAPVLAHGSSPRPAAAPGRGRVGGRGLQRRSLRPVHRGRRPARGAQPARERRSRDGGLERRRRRRAGTDAPGRPCCAPLARDPGRGPDRPAAARGWRPATGSRSNGTGAPRSGWSAWAPGTALASTRPGARSSSAPIGATPAPTARRRCSPTGGIPQGDCAPVPWLLSSRGYAVWVRTHANGTRFDLRRPDLDLDPRLRRPARARPAVRADPRGPAARLLRADRLPGAAARMGLRVLEEPRRVRASGRRARGLPRLPPPPDPARRDRDRLALGDSVQHLGVQPLPVPRCAGPDRDDAGARRAHRRVGDAVGQPRLPRRSDPAAARVRAAAPRAGSELRVGRRRPATSSASRAASRSCGSGGWAPARRSTSPARPRRSGGGSRPSACSSSGSRGSRPTTARATTSRTTFASPTGARAPPAHGRSEASTGIRCSARSTRSIRGVACCSAAAAGAAQHATGSTWAGDQASDFWSLRVLVVATLSAACSGVSNWSHDVGGYLGHRLVERCPPELLVRWLQFGCFTPLMQAHARMPQEPWHYGERVLATYRAYVLLHEQLVPYVRAAAATAARTGLPIIRPLCLTDPADERGWTITDAYGYGPALWVAPVLDDGAREREVALPRGEWIETWSGRHVHGGGEVLVEAPLSRIPVWVRSGSIVVTYPAEHVAAGLGDDARVGAATGCDIVGPPAPGPSRRAARRRDADRVAARRVVAPRRAPGHRARARDRVRRRCSLGRQPVSELLGAWPRSRNGAAGC